MKLNVYGNAINSEYIARTAIEYGNTYLTVYQGEQLTNYEIPNNTPISIRAFPDAGCQFDRWAFRIGSATDALQYDDTNPFTYAGPYDVYVRAEGSEITSTDTVAKWDWFSSNDSADAQETIDSLLALISGTPTTDFSHRVWNDIVNKVYDMLEYRELTWEGKANSDYYTYSNTKMTTSSTNLSAKRYNTLLRNFKNVIKDIGSNYDTALEYVNKGDIVYPYHILNFTDEINYWIDGL